MAFLFVVETGIGDPDANSYTDIDYATDYISTNAFQSDAWDALDTDAQQKLLVRSSKYLDNMVQWNGTRVDDESGLRWPRAGVYDVDGFEIPDDVIPTLLQDAVCEFVSNLMSDDWTANQSSRGLREIEVDVIKLTYDNNYVRASLPDYVIEMLNPLGQVRSGIRPAFKKIYRT